MKKKKGRAHAEKEQKPVAKKEEKDKPWWQDILEVIATLAVIIIVLQLLFGAHMTVPLVAVVSCSMLHQDDVIGSVSQGISQIVWPILLDGPCSYDASPGWRTWITDRVPGANIDSFPLKSGFSVGDMVLVITPDGTGTIIPLFSPPRIGDVVIYKIDKNAVANEPIIHRVVGLVKVDNGSVSSVEGTLDCFTKENFQNTFIPAVHSCQIGESSCPYRDYPKGASYSFYITKGDNNRVTDQCRGGYYRSILPVTDAQVVARGFLRIPYIGWFKIILGRFLGLLGVPNIF
jgi:signal peptidase I